MPCVELVLLPSERSDKCYFSSLYPVSSESIDIGIIVRSGNNTPCHYRFELNVSEIGNPAPENALYQMTPQLSVVL